MKERIGEHIALVDGPSDIEYVRGHVTLEQASGELIRELGTGATSIKHRWARWVPVKWADYSMELVVGDVHTRGTFAVSELRMQDICEVAR